jgi:hypothetical protein
MDVSQQEYNTTIKEKEAYLGFFLRVLADTCPKS